MGLKDLKVNADKIVLGTYPGAVLKQIHVGSFDGGNYEGTDSDVNSWRFQYDVGDTVSIFVCANIKDQSVERTGNTKEYIWSDLEKNLSVDGVDEKWSILLPSVYEKWNTYDVLNAKGTS